MLNMKSYAEMILEAHEYLLTNHQEVFVIGQGLWSPWYVGKTMLDLEKKDGKNRLIDSPVSEVAVTGAALGASISGFRPIVVHPRMDFMILAVDQIVTQAANWSHMFGGKNNPALTIRGIINRGGEQGAQHSQSLHSWFAHIPGLRVIMPATPKDARDLLISSVLCDDPVLFIDDRWLYDWQFDEEDNGVEIYDLASISPRLVTSGSDLTIVTNSYSTLLVYRTIQNLPHNIKVDLIDLRSISNINYECILDSVKKTQKLLVVDGGWLNCGLAGEIIASVSERLDVNVLKKKPKRIGLPPSPAPTSKVLENHFYPNIQIVREAIMEMIDNND